MPVTIHGQTSGRERDAAESLAQRFRMILRADDRITIVSGAKCHGQVRKDVDLLVFGFFPTGLRLPSHLMEPVFQDRPTLVRSFTLTIEVKDHVAEDVRVEGTHVQVRYRDRWSSATEQAFQEKDSVRRFLEARGVGPPFVASAVWLRNVSQADLPEHQDLLGTEADPLECLGIFARASARSLHSQRKGGDRYWVASIRADSASELEDTMRAFTQELHPSVIDRRRLEVICQNILRDQKYAELLGQQLLVFRGRGGAGKTLRLLQIARTRYETHGDRILLLTYNKALLADLRRLMALLRASDRLHQQAISVQTNDSFLWGALGAFDLTPTENPNGGFPRDYCAKKKQLLERVATIPTGTILERSEGQNNPSLFDYDLVLVDEAQDWPAVDRDLVYAIFGSDHVIVADGVDQFVTGHSLCDWTLGKRIQRRQVVSLPKALRLKSNLCRFARSFASRLDFDWDLQVNDDVPGGRVLVVRGPYWQDLHVSTMDDHARNGNTPLDALFVVTGTSGAAGGDLPRLLRSWGLQVWDGTCDRERRAYPTDIAQHRVVKYESSRGLEGWTVVCLDLDLFHDRQLTHPSCLPSGERYASPSEVAREHAARWCMIPLTRAIDTLVLQVTPGSRLDAVLLDLASEHQDFVRRIDTA